MVRGQLFIPIARKITRAHSVPRDRMAEVEKEQNVADHRAKNDGHAPGRGALRPVQSLVGFLVERFNSRAERADQDQRRHEHWIEARPGRG